MTSILVGSNVLEKPLQGRAVGRSAGEAAIVISRTDQGPAGMGLAADIGLGRIILGVERVEVLIQPGIGRDPGVDRAADCLPAAAVMTWPPERLVPQTKEPRAVPLGTGDGEGDLGEAVIGLALPGEAVVDHHHPMGMTVPLARQDGAGFEFSPSRSNSSVRREASGPATGSDMLEQSSGSGIEIAQLVGLEPIGENRQQEVTGQMDGGCRRKMLFHRNRKPCRSRSRKCAISPSNGILVAFFATGRVCRIALRRR